MNIRKIDEHFATTGQIRPEEIEMLADQGYAAIVCARPDGEEPGQPAFSEIAREAEKHGLKAFHIPVAGTPTEDQVTRFAKAIATIEGPVLGYCRSGARSAALYSSIER